MMDLKEIIKWFIPCFHILLVILKNKDLRLTFICLFLLFNFQCGCAALAGDVRIDDTKNVELIYENNLNDSQSDFISQFSDGSVGRTFGRPFKKMMGALLPLIFQIGAASTWAVVAALVGIKTLFVTLIILKLLLVAGAAKTFMMLERHLAEVNAKLKTAAPVSPLHDFQDNMRNPYQNQNHGDRGVFRPFLGDHSTTKKREVRDLQDKQVGALFASKGHGHYQHGWEPPHHPHPQKEIHLHIHNGHHEGQPHAVQDDHIPYGSWSREDASNTVETKYSDLNPYPVVGPQTIRTPYGNYVKVESGDSIPTKRK